MVSFRPAPLRAGGQKNELQSQQTTPKYLLEEISERLNLRTCHMPLQYIVGVWSFREIRYRAVRPVFIPRFETEQLLTILSKNIGDLQPLKFLDLCCGSGVIGISLAKQFGGSGVAVDLNKICIQVSRQNLQLNGISTDRIEFVHGDCVEYLRTTIHKFNLIVTNPPYINQKNMSELSKQVIQYESKLALYGGTDGLDYVREILKEYKRILVPGGVLAIEYDGAGLTGQLEQYDPYVVKDFYGNRRFIIIHN